MKQRSTPSGLTIPSPDQMRHAMRGVPAAVVLVAAEVDDRSVGMLATSFASVSLDPPLVTVSFGRSSTSWEQLRRTRAVGVSVLPAGHHELLQQLSRPTATRFDDVLLAPGEDGALLLPEAPLLLTASPHAEFEAGDHVLTLFDVLRARRDPHVEPLVLHDRQVRSLLPA